MATKTLVPVEVYDRTSYDPDREYIDGELKERNLGTLEHAKVQGLFVMLFNLRRQEWKVQAWPAWRMRVSPPRVRIPDVCVVPIGPFPAVLSEPPLVAIEVLSADDTYGDVREKALDYARMGVPNIWLVDPIARTGQEFRGDHWVDVTEFAVPSTPIRIALADLFAEFDRFNQTAE
jgi:Uma2 family endonuclease